MRNIAERIGKKLLLRLQLFRTFPQLNRHLIDLAVQNTQFPFLIILRIHLIKAFPDPAHLIVQLPQPAVAPRRKQTERTDQNSGQADTDNQHLPGRRRGDQKKGQA